MKIDFKRELIEWHFPLLAKPHAPVGEDEEAHERDERVVPPQDDEVDRTDEELRLTPQREQGDEGVGGWFRKLKSMEIILYHGFQDLEIQFQGIRYK